MGNYLLLGSLLLIASLSTFAAEETTIEVSEAWARESPPMVDTGAAYMTLINKSERADWLLGASGNVADTIELHTHLREGDVMKMRRIDAVEIKPNEPTVLEPGGLHLMLIGLKEPLQAGQTFPLTLRFEQVGELSVEVVVRRIVNGNGQSHGGHEGMSQDMNSHP